MGTALQNRRICYAKSDRFVFALLSALAIASFGCGAGSSQNPGTKAGETKPLSSEAAKSNSAPNTNGITTVPTAQSGPKARPVKMPESKVGTGGNDFFLFTQVRGAIASNPDLAGANVNVDVKDGGVILSGTVVNAAQKTKAEIVAQSINGVKSIKNNISVAAKK